MSDYFINNHTGNRTSKLIAKKKPDGTYETEPEIKARLSGSWNVQDVECTYDEAGNCITSPAHSGKKARRNRKSKARRKMKKAKATEDNSPESEEDNVETPVEEELPADAEKLEDQDDGMKDVPNVEADVEETPIDAETPDEVEDVETPTPENESTGEESPAEEPEVKDVETAKTDLMSLTHAELKDLAKRAGEKVSGTKAELVARLTGSEDPV